MYAGDGLRPHDSLAWVALHGSHDMRQIARLRGVFLGACLQDCFALGRVLTPVCLPLL
jgi:hypothetical protein